MNRYLILLFGLVTLKSYLALFALKSLPYSRDHQVQILGWSVIFVDVTSAILSVTKENGTKDTYHVSGNTKFTKNNVSGAHVIAFYKGGCVIRIWIRLHQHKTLANDKKDNKEPEGCDTEKVFQEQPGSTEADVDPPTDHWRATIAVAGFRRRCPHLTSSLVAKLSHTYMTQANGGGAGI